MKKIIRNILRVTSLRTILATIVLSSLFVSCIDNEDIIDEEESGRPRIELKFIADESYTKSVTGDAASSFLPAEKKMNTVDIFFYLSTATENDAPAYVYHIDNTEHNTTHTIFLSEELKTTLFGTDGTTCKVYTVVNVESMGDAKDSFNYVEEVNEGNEEKLIVKTAKKETMTIAQLKNIKASTPTFATEFDGIAMFTKDDNGDVINYETANRKASGTLKVKNLAAKIDLFINFGDENEQVEGIDPADPGSSSKTWNLYQPATTKDKNGQILTRGTVEVYMINGATAVKLSGWDNGNDETKNDYINNRVSAFLANDDYYDSRNEINNKQYPHHLEILDEETVLKESDKEYKYLTVGSFYSYPTQWTADVLEQHRGYLMVKVNWYPEEIKTPLEKDLIETYYRIPINMSGDSENKLLSNRHYRVKISINTLGGINFGAPLDLDNCSWEVLPWGSTEINADIHEVRWLEVDNEQADVYDEEDNKYIKYAAVMDNTTSVTIPYNSSHKVYLKSVEIKYYNFTPASGYIPELVSVIAYKQNGKKPEKDKPNRGDPGYDDLKTYGVDANVFTLTDDKIQWFKERDEDVNGLYIDHENQRITFYHSIYPLIGNNSSSMPGEGIYRGVYQQIGDKTYSPFYITLVLAHEDKKDFERNVNIIQYPGVYVTFTKSTGRNADGTSIGRKVPNGAGDAASIRYGVYVNGGGTNPFKSFSNNDPSNCFQLGGIGGKGRSNNTNMYAIHVTQLSEDDFETFTSRTSNDGPISTINARFHIGDPRTKHVNNNLAGDADLVDVDDINGWDKQDYSTSNVNTRSNARKVPATLQQGGAQRLYPTDRTTTALRYYYPTAEGQGEEQMFRLAPVFRLASGNSDLYEGSYWGDKSSDRLSRESARRRCAALQENGYPAGRWRIPTLGEFLFFKMLQKRNVLPEIFVNSRAHWTAQYLVKYGQNDVDIRIYPADDPMDHKWVRCVYDDWYWVKGDNKTPDVILNNTDKVKSDYATDVNGDRVDVRSYYGDDDLRTMFVWGDKEKNNPLEQPEPQD